MQNEKHYYMMFLLYLLSLLGLVIFNMVKDINLNNLVYLVVIICCVLKYFVIVLDKRK